MTTQAFWLDEIKRYESDAEKWGERARKVLKRFKDERARNESSAKRFNILWANVKILQPALYARDPIPRVKRRFKDRKPLPRIASEVLERCLSYSIECTEYGNVMRQSVTDRLLPGRGTAWVRYVPHLTAESEDTGAVTDDVQQELYYEEAVPDYVHWEDFGHTYARTWEELRAVWRIAYMTRDELVERFGDIGNEVELDFDPTAGDKRKTGKVTEDMKRACIYEIWDKQTRSVIWLSKSHEAVLDEKDDPLQLADFFPCPRPLFANLSNDSLIPIPDYCQYQDQAEEIDGLTGRVSAIAKCIKVAGAYDQQTEALGRIFTEGFEGALIPVAQWSRFAERGGLSGVMDLLPTDVMSKTLTELINARQVAKQDLFEVTGISDIVRGFNSGGDKTATEQQIKSQYANLRLSDQQREVQAFARDLLRIMGQIIAGKFTQETIAKISGYELMTEEEKQQAQMIMQQYQQMQQQHGQLAQQAQQMGQQPPPPPPPPDPQLQKGLSKPSWEEVMGLLRNHAEFGFSIEIETDSTIALDEQGDKAADAEMIQAIGGFSQAVAPSIQMGLMNPKVAQAVQNSMIRKYRFGRDVEEAIEDAEGQPPQQQAGMDPRAQQELQKAQQQVQQDAQANQEASMKLKEQAMQNKHEKEMIGVDAQKQQLTIEKAMLALQSLVDQFNVQAEGAKKDSELRAKNALDLKEQAQGAQEAAQMGQQQQQIVQIGQQIIEALSQPKQIVRGPDGRAAGIAPATVQ